MRTRQARKPRTAPSVTAWLSYLALLSPIEKRGITAVRKSLNKERKKVLAALERIPKSAFTEQRRVKRKLFYDRVIDLIADHQVARNRILDLVEDFVIEHEQRFNPNHDPDNGQFTEGPGGSSEEKSESGDDDLFGRVEKMRSTPFAKESSSALVARLGNDVDGVKLSDSLARFETQLQAQKPTETLIGFDENGNETQRMEGGTGSVDMEREDAEKMRGGILSHNHPSGRSFSIEDYVASSTINAREMRAFGALPGKLGDQGGYLYILTRLGDSWPDPNDVWRVFNTYDRQIFARFNAKIQKGEIDIATANLNHGHEVWTRVAKTFRDGFRYERRRVGT